MQQQAQPQGGTQFGASTSQILPFSSAPLASRAHLLGIPPPDEVASPISSRPPPPSAAGNFDKLQVAGELPDDEAFAAAAAGDDPERGVGSSTGNRWPQQETLALLEIRSKMDASFRDATLKSPLWEEVSRKLAELGYNRSAKKCKEKFENVHKYYKRTKEGRAGRQDGKSYRFFTQLEALHSGISPSTGPPAVTALAAQAVFADASGAMVGQPPANRAEPISSVAPPPPIVAVPTRAVAPELVHGISTSGALTVGFSFSSNSSSSASSDSDEDTAGESQEGRKRKREAAAAATTSRKMMAFFDGLMKQVMERQEAMHQRFLEAIEKRDQERMVREEAWRRQELTRLNREQELLAQEWAMAASRDTTIISYLQKITGQNISLPTPGPIPPTAPGISAVPLQQPPPSSQSTLPPSLSQSTPPPPPSQNDVPQSTPPPAAPPQASQTQPPQIQQSPSQVANIARRQSPLPPTLELDPNSEPPPSSLDAISPTLSSRWPKAEVHALIKLRSGLDSKYLDSGSKGPLWEEVSTGMQRLGYNRSAKRCKEKWENINKYYKKVKESNKKRLEDSKTCPYFHQLDALYRGKLLNAGGGSMQRPQGPDQSTNTIPPSSNQQQTDAITTNRLREQEPVIQPLPKSATEAETKNGNSDINAGVQKQTGNGGLTAGFFDQELKHPEDITKELMEQRQHPAAMDHDYDKLDDDSDNTGQDDEDEDEDDDNDNDEIKNNEKILHYKI